MRPYVRRALLRLIIAAPVLACAATAGAEPGYPSRPVKVVVAFPPGQSTDIATRYLADKLSQSLGQSFVVENRAGASGNIGTTSVARAAPDGYTLLMGTSATHALNPALYKNPGYDAEKDFDPIILTALIPFAISVGADAGIHSLQELVAQARQRPGKVDAALPSVTGQLVLEMLKQREVPLFGVRFKGSADAMTAVLGGHVPVLIDTVAATRTQLGRIKPLAVTTAAPLASMPGVKTASEQGLANFNVAAWNALVVPKGVPAEIQAKLASELRKVLDLPETKKKLAELGFEQAPVMDRPALAAWMHAELQKYVQIVNAAQMKPE